VQAKILKKALIYVLELYAIAEKIHFLKKVFFMHFHIITYIPGCGLPIFLRPKPHLAEV